MIASSQTCPRLRQPNSALRRTLPNPQGLFAAAQRVEKLIPINLRRANDQRRVGISFDRRENSHALRAKTLRGIQRI